MRVVVFSAQPYDREYLEPALKNAGHQSNYLSERLTEFTASLAIDADAVCVFVNDVINAEIVEQLASNNVKIIALRCAGFNNVDLEACQKANIAVVRVPAYSPYAVAEHTIGLILCLNRKFHRAFNRVREGQFNLNGLLGFDLHGRTVGVIGTGQIGKIVCKILLGFGCRVLAYDVHIDTECEALGVSYRSLDELLQQSQIVTLHCPLTPDTRHIINQKSLSSVQDGVMIINTSRGALVDTQAVINGLKSGKIGTLGLDVYEEEANLFFRDLSGQIIQDDVFARLLTFPNVLVTAHQAFFTEEALKNIADTTSANLSDIEAGRECPNRLMAP